jgi:hypothetical protein
LVGNNSFRNAIWRQVNAFKKQKLSSELLESKEYTVPSNQSVSIADELHKLADLKKKEY